MIILKRVGNDVFFDGKKLTMVTQASKGPNKECVKIAGLPGANGQTWVSLTRLKEGENSIETQGREVTITKKKAYTLTDAEQAKVDKLQKEIDSIIQVAKDRYVPKPNLNLDPSKMTQEERDAAIAEIIAYYNMKKS